MKLAKSIAAETGQNETLVLEKTVAVGPPGPLVGPVVVTEQLDRGWSLVRSLRRYQGRGDASVITHIWPDSMNLSNLQGQWLDGEAAYTVATAEPMVYTHVKVNGPQLRALGEYRAWRQLLIDLQSYLGGLGIERYKNIDIPG